MKPKWKAKVVGRKNVVCYGSYYESEERCLMLTGFEEGSLHKPRIIAVEKGTAVQSIGIAFDGRELYVGDSIRGVSTGDTDWVITWEPHTRSLVLAEDGDVNGCKEDLEFKNTDVVYGNIFTEEIY